MTSVAKLYNPLTNKNPIAAASNRLHRAAHRRVQRIALLGRQRLKRRKNDKSGEHRSAHGHHCRQNVQPAKYQPQREHQCHFDSFMRCAHTAQNGQLFFS